MAPSGPAAPFPFPFPQDGGAPLLGRAADLAAMVAVLERARAGGPGPRVAVLYGDPGVGKSTLLQAIVALAAAEGYAVLSGRAAEPDGRIPYALLADALGGEADGDPGGADGVHRALDPGVELSGAGPTLVGQVPALVAERLVRLLRARSSRTPCVLTFDDLHAADDDSFAVIANLVHRMPRSCVLFAAARPRPPDLPTGLAALLERQADEGSAILHRLDPLAPDAAAELAARWLGATPDDALAAGLWESCRGNPFYLRQAIRSLEEAEALARSGTRVALATATEPILASANSLRLRLARLGGAAERTARVLTAFPAVEVHDLTLVAELAELPVPAVEQAFDLLVVAGFLDRSADGRFSFSHPVVRDTLHAMLGPAERRRLHGAIAARLFDRREGGTPVRVVELAHHVAESAVPGDARAVALLAEAGETALPEAPHAAARWLRQALALLPRDAPERGDLLVRLARALYLTDADEEVAEAGREATDVLPPGPDLERIVSSAIAKLAYLRRLEEALALADRALAGHDVPMPAVLAEKARVLGYLKRFEEAATLAERALGMGRSGGSPVEAMSRLADMAHARGQAAESEELYAAALALAGGERTPDRLAVLCRWAPRKVSYGYVDEGLAMADEAGRLSTRLGGAFPAVAGHLRLTRAAVAWLRGRWDELLAEAAVAAPDRFVTDEIVGLFAADVLVERGEVAKAAGIVEELGTQPAFPVQWAWAAAGVAAAGGDPDRARKLLGDVVDGAGRAGLWLFAHRALLRLVELEHAAGNLDAAWDRLTTLELVAKISDTPLTWVAARRARGLVVADPAPLHAALSITEEHGLVVKGALVRLQLGTLGESPKEHLRSAFATFRSIGAERWRSRTAAALRARGIPVPRQPRRPPGTLTDTERRLARYVADGLTNREIATEMSLSVGTVATYLARVFALTGTANRRELGQAVRRGALDDARG
jgi:DNA-binding CsgD family transcriptional regulator